MTSSDGDTQPQRLEGIREVAVIGAGISGVATAAHLLRHGLRVTVFERSTIAGGVWHYDTRTSADPSYPNEFPQRPTNEHEDDGLEKQDQQPQRGRITTTQDEGGEEATALAHAPPGPCYAGLRNNVPTSLMRSTLLSWPEGTPEFVSQVDIEHYVQELARTTGTHDNIRYATSVESVAKKPSSSSSSADGGATQWTLKTRTLVRGRDDDGGDGGIPRFVTETLHFDAVVVASGHYHEPRVPGVPGLAAWKAQWPERVTHSKQYRTPDVFRDQTVLIVGAGVSSLDIAREGAGIARRIYQSARGGKFDPPANLLPENAERVAAVTRFIVNGEGQPTGEVELADGRILSGIDRVVLATGYITSYPFLGPVLQAPNTPASAADDRVIVTADGCLTHNLHEDMFYIPDPTLIFVGVPYHISTFSLFDFQAEVAARVLAGWTRLPGRSILREQYTARRATLTSQAAAKEFHSLFGREVEYIDRLLAWVNSDTGARPSMRGVDDAWRVRRAEFHREMRKIRGLDAPDADADEQKLTQDLWAIAGEVARRTQAATAAT